MHLFTSINVRSGISTRLGKRLSNSKLILGGCLLFFCLLGTAHAEKIVVLDEGFETDPPNFQIGTQQTGDAVATFAFGDTGISRGLIFTGSYLTKENVDVFEFANGILNPVVPTFEDYHLYPKETDGVASVSVSIDAIVEGLPSDNGNSNGVIAFIFQLWQPEGGLWQIYQVDQTFTNKTWESIGWINLTAEDFEREDGKMPDFSPTAEPIVFGFFTGIGYKWVSGPGQVITTSARLDNWKVEADVGLTVFEDGFEARVE